MESSSVKDYRLTLNVRNNRILDAMERRGFANVAALCRAMSGLESMQGEVGKLIAMKKSPLLKTGDFRPFVIEMAGVLRTMPCDLFNEEQLEGFENTSVSMELDQADVAALLPSFADGPDAALELEDLRNVLDSELSKLTEKQADALRMHFGLEGEEKNFTEMGKIENRSTANSRQIVNYALRKLRGRAYLGNFDAVR